MKTARCRCLGPSFALLCLFALGPGCQDPKPRPSPPPTAPTAAPEVETEAAAAPEPEPAGEVKKVQVSKNVWLETQGDRRRVLVSAEICLLPEGGYPLECLLCRTNSKEHESILATEADARAIHASLVALGAIPGSPVRFDPVFRPPAGTPIKVSLRYVHKGQTVTVPAQKWIRLRDDHEGEGKPKAKGPVKTLEYDWVFAGSQFWPNALDPKGPDVYAAALEGAYICVTNVPTAMLDLPINSPKAIEARAYVPHTDVIPPDLKHVVVVLEPLPEGKKVETGP